MNWLVKVFHVHRPLPESMHWDPYTKTEKGTCRCGKEMTNTGEW